MTVLVTLQNEFNCHHADLATTLGLSLHNYDLGAEYSRSATLLSMIRAAENAEAMGYKVVLRVVFTFHVSSYLFLEK